MAISHTVCASFKLEKLQGIHDLRTDQLKIALYTSAASLSFATTVYTTTGEISGGNYVAGGKDLEIASGFPKLNVSAEGDTPAGYAALLDFDDIAWDILNATVRGALIYNSTKANRALMALDFGSDIVITNGPLSIQWPIANPSTVIHRIL